MASDLIKLEGAKDLQGEKMGYDPHTADAAYKPFPPFSAWKDIEVDTTRWERYVEQQKKMLG